MPRPRLALPRCCARCPFLLLLLLLPELPVAAAPSAGPARRSHPPARSRVGVGGEGGAAPTGLPVRPRRRAQADDHRQLSAGWCWCWCWWPLVARRRLRSAPDAGGRAARRRRWRQPGPPSCAIEPGTASRAEETGRWGRGGLCRGPSQLTNSWDSRAWPATMESERPRSPSPVNQPESDWSCPTMTGLTGVLPLP